MIVPSDTDLTADEIAEILLEKYGRPETESYILRWGEWKYGDYQQVPQTATCSPEDLPRLVSTTRTDPPSLMMYELRPLPIRIPAKE